MSIGHHLLNNESQKYFQQMHCMSGVATTILTYQHGNHRCTMEKFANSFEPINNDEDLIAFLKNVSVDDLMRLTDATNVPTRLIFAPVIEGWYLLLSSYIFTHTQCNNKYIYAFRLLQFLLI